MSQGWDTLENITSRIQLMLTGGLVTDESRVDFDLLRDSIHVARAAHLAEKLRRKLTIHPQYYQRICCLKIVCQEVACEGIAAGNEMVVTIPPVFGQFGKKSVKSVSDVLGTNQFTQVDDISARHKPAFIKSNNVGGRYMLRGDNLLVLANLPTQGMEYVCVEFLTTDPCNPLITSCDKSERYPVPADELEPIEMRAYERYRAMVGIPTDVTNDTVANPV